MSSGFGTDTKEQVKRATDIVDLIGSYAQLRRSGSNYVCNCFFHDDRRPSLQINPARQSWACWVCNIRGDVFDFIMRKEGVEFFEALKILAERSGIPLNIAQKRAVKGSPQDKQTLYAAMKWAVARFNSYLLESKDALAARNYLSDRGMTADVISDFKLGFAPLKWSWLSDQASHTEFSNEVLSACDLIAPSDRSSGYFERFRGRLIFPIFDTMARPIAIGGRLVPGVDLESPAKYVNSRETRLFSKSDVLYGLNMVKGDVAKTRELTIVEGYTDVIAAWQAGLRNVVACLGTALNQKHIRLIKRFADRITLVLDGDEAGIRRTNEILDLFVANEVDLRILTLPDGLDPMDFLQKQGTESFNQLVEKASDAIDHKIRIETAGIDLVQETHQANMALDRILQTLARVPAAMVTTSADKILRQEQLTTRLARQFGVERDQIKRRLIELRSRTTSFVEAETAPLPAFDFSKLSRRESELIQLILHAPEFLDTIVENVSPEQFAEGPLKQLYSLIDDCFQDGEDTTFDELMLTIEDANLKNLLVYLDNEWQEKCSTETNIGDRKIGDLVEEVLGVFRELEIETGNRKKISELQNPNLNQEDQLTTLEDLLNQTRQRHGL